MLRLSNGKNPNRESKLEGNSKSRGGVASDSVSTGAVAHLIFEAEYPNDRTLGSVRIDVVDDDIIVFLPGSSSA